VKSYRDEPVNLFLAGFSHLEPLCGSSAETTEATTTTGKHTTSLHQEGCRCANQSSYTYIPSAIKDI
jgi:hypothetical protein